MQKVGAKSPLDRLAIALSMVFGIGKIPKAPGTFGSLPGLGLGYLVHVFALGWTASGDSGFSSVVLTALLLVLAVAVAYWTIARTEAVLGIHDDQRIVIDEVVGQAIAVAFVTPSLPVYVAGFLLFRLFDITKPLAIGTIDRELPGAAGTLFDDVLAGQVAAALLCGGVMLLKHYALLP